MFNLKILHFNDSLCKMREPFMIKTMIILNYWFVPSLDGVYGELQSN